MQYATAYWNDGTIPPAFRWLNELYDADEEGSNVNWFPLREHVDGLKKRRIDAVRLALERKKQRDEAPRQVIEASTLEKMDVDVPLRDIESFGEGEEQVSLELPAEVAIEATKEDQDAEIENQVNGATADLPQEPDTLHQFIQSVMQHEHSPDAEVQDTAVRTETPFSESVDGDHPSSDTNEESKALLEAVLTRIEQEGKAEEQELVVQTEEVDDVDVKMEEVSPVKILFEAIMQEEAKNTMIEGATVDADVSMEEAPKMISPGTENAAVELLEAVITRMESDLESMTIVQTGNDVKPQEETTDSAEPSTADIVDNATEAPLQQETSS